MYANDVIFVKFIPSDSIFASAVLNHDFKILELIAEWFISNDLPLNPVKSQCVFWLICTDIQYSILYISLYSVSLEIPSSARVLSLC